MLFQKLASDFPTVGVQPKHSLRSKNLKNFIKFIFKKVIFLFSVKVETS